MDTRRLMQSGPGDELTAKERFQYIKDFATACKDNPADEAETKDRFEFIGTVAQAGVDEQDDPA